MKIGTIGSDERAVAIGKLLRVGGHDVTIGDPVNAKAERQRCPGDACRVAVQARDESDLLVFAVPREEVDQP